jgi:hypothetical protein
LNHSSATFFSELGFGETVRVARGIVMTDVVEIAKKRREILVGEIARLDEFILMAEKLAENNGNDAEEKGDSSAINLFAGTKA